MYSPWPIDLKSGMLQTSHNNLTVAGSLTLLSIVSDWAKVFKANKSSESRAFISDGLSGKISSDLMSLSMLPNSKFAFRHCNVVWGAKRCSIIEVATFVSSGFASPVTPKVPLFIPRPARPAI